MCARRATIKLHLLCVFLISDSAEQSLTYVKKNGLEKEVVILVLELAVGGELFDFMMYTGAFPEVIARTYFRQVRDTPIVAMKRADAALTECTSVRRCASNLADHDLHD